MNTPIASNAVDKGMGTQSEVMPNRTTSGNNANATTAMNNAALAGINPNLIGTHAAGITTHVAKLQAEAKSAKPDHMKMAQHIQAIQSHVSAAKTHVSKVARQSESDAGDMSHYDPQGGLSKAEYSRVTKGEE